MKRELIAMVEMALKEDGINEDITTSTLLSSKNKMAVGFIIVKQGCVLSGLEMVSEVYRQISRRCRVMGHARDGQRVKSGMRIVTIKGPISDLLTGERVALNFLQQLSGVATYTHQFVDRVKPFRVRVLDTRKTIPGFRYLQKKAVLDGGGFNHRKNLSDMFLIKENHIKAAGGIDKAIQQVKKMNLKKKPIEIEVRNLREFEIALKYKPDMILLDNMKLHQIRKAVQLTREFNSQKKCLLEVSGGVNLKNVRSIAKTGVSRISIGALTHSAPAVDMSFLIES